MNNFVSNRVKFQKANGEKKLILLRKKVSDLHFKYGQSKNQISFKERVSKKFVIKWTSNPSQDFEADQRGWQKGKGRKYLQQDVKKVIRLHKQLKGDKHNFFQGASAVLQQWRIKYPDSPAPSLRTIGRIMQQEGLSKSQRSRVKGASAYLCYPEHTLYERMGGRILEADFIGKKYIDGSSEPVNFIGFSFKKSPRIRHYQRIQAQTSECFIRETKRFFDQFEKPDFIKVDNCLATIGSASGKRNLSKAMLFCFRHQVNPIFSVPRRPFTQASIEGNNSVFSRHFWNRSRFSSLKQIDKELNWFNTSSLRYTDYKKPAFIKEKTDYTPKVYFLRQVLENEEKEGYIDILNEKLRLEKSFINYYVLADWDIEKQVITVSIEKQQKLVKLLSQDFLVNPCSKEKLFSTR